MRKNPRRVLRGQHNLVPLSAIALAIACQPRALNASTINWNGTGTGWDSVSDWSTDPANPTPNPAAVPGSGDLATFNISTVNSNQTVNLNAAQSAMGLVFNSTGTVGLQGGGTNRILSLGTSGITINPGAGNVTVGSSTAGQNVALSLAGSQTWVNNGTGTATIFNGTSLATAGAQIVTLDGSNTGTNTVTGAMSNGSGTLSVVKNGTGEWILGSGQTFTGGVTLNAGTLGLVAGTSSGTNPSGVTITGPSTLQFEATIPTGSALASGRVYAIGSSANPYANITIDTQGFNIFAANPWNSVSGGYITKIGSGALIFNNTTTDNSGLGIVVTAGSLLMAKTGGAHSIGGGGLSINGTTAVVQLGAVSMGGVAGNGDQIYDGAGAGTVNITAGTFDMYGDSETIATLTGNGGTITDTYAGAASAGTTSTLTIGDTSNTANSNYSGVIANGASGLGVVAIAKGGNASLTLGGSNTYTGGTTINAGTLAISKDVNLGASSSALTLNGGTLSVTSSISGFSHTINTGTTGGTFNIASGQTLQTNNFDSTAATITGSGTITVNGGQLSLSGDDSGFSGNWNLSSGIIESQYHGSAALGSGSVTIAAGAELANGFSQTISNPIISNGGIISFASFDGGQYTGPINLASGITTLGLRDFYSTGTARSGNITGLISGSGGLLISGTGATVLSSPSNSYSGGTNVSSGTVTFAAPYALPNFSALTIGSGAVVKAATFTGTKNTLFTSSLSIAGSTGAWTGKLDLNNNDLVVQSGVIADITNQVMQGSNGGAWNGSNGIISSAAASDTTHLHALGVIQNSVDGTTTGAVLYSPTNTVPNAFDNATAGAATDVLVKYTYYGDANLDGQVDGSDYTLIDHGFNTDAITPGSLTGWYNGDFNYDNVIDGSDYTLIDNAFNTQGTPIAALIANSSALIAGSGTTSAVPEPTTLGLIGITVAGLLGRRTRRRH